MREMRRLSLAWPLPYGWEKQEAMLVSYERGKEGGSERGKTVPHLFTCTHPSLPPSLPPSLRPPSPPVISLIF